MNTVYLLTGGNMGNRLNHLQQAAEFIQQKCGKIVAQSSIYETEAWGKTDQPAFLNQALQVETDLSPDALMQALLDIETEWDVPEPSKWDLGSLIWIFY